MSDTSTPRDRRLVLVALFSWAIGLLTGVLLSAVYGLLRTPKAVQVEYAFPPPTPRPLPTPTPTPDCPAFRIWSSCDPVPRTGEDMDKALMSDAVGWIDIITPGQWRVRVDGVSYGLIPPWKRQPIVPGRHALDLFDYQGMRHVRCDVDIVKGRQLRASADTRGDCVITDVTDQARP
jgi:hypothetical protein